MKTKNELIQECKDANPVIIQIINGVEIELTGNDYEQACSDWADMKLAQLTVETEAEAQATAKAELLERLGITADEAKLLLA
jgi:hypothetical protein